MKRQALIAGLFCIFSCLSFSVRAGQPEIPPIHLKPDAKIMQPPREIRITIQGPIRELLCEDNEILVEDSATRREYRVFPTEMIAGTRIRQHADISRLCRQHLRHNQTVRVSGVPATVAGRRALSRATVTPIN